MKKLVNKGKSINLSHQLNKNINDNNRILICAGYCGTNMNGSQFQTNISIEKTIEGKLLKNLQNIGILKKEKDNIKNLNLLKKLYSEMNFNCSSRTDKGVHAICNLFSLQLNNLQQNNLENNLLEELNFNLQNENVKLFYLNNFNNNLNKNEINLRKIVKHRTYEYFIPSFALKVMKSMIVKDDIELKRNLQNCLQKNSLQNNNLQQICNQLNFVFSKMEGINSFHNFTTFVKTNENLNDLIDDASSDMLTNDAMPEEGNNNKMNNEINEEEEINEENNKINKKQNQFIRTVLQCSAKPHILPIPHYKLYNSFNNKNNTLQNFTTNDMLEGILIKITCNGFLYHQIRKMVGLALAHYLFPKQINEEFIDFCLFSKERMFIPTAPSEPLILTFSTLNDLNLEREIYGNTFYNGQKELNNKQQKKDNGSGSLLRPEFIDGCSFNKEMEQFRTEVIYPNILLETNASCSSIQSFIASKVNGKSNKSFSSWVQLASEIKFHLSSLLEQKEKVSKKAKHQIRERKRTFELLKLEEERKREECDFKEMYNKKLDLLPNGYRLHFCITFKCLINEERAINAFNNLEQMILKGQIKSDNISFEYFDNIVREKRWLERI
ncbi:hypothetical protein ABK040_013124 [Willaertia magna]